MPINPVHIAVTHDGKVLVVAGSGWYAKETNYRAAVWDPVAGTIVTQPLAWDMFCNGMSVLPDGRVFINGGNLQYDPFYGEPRSAVFDPVTSTFTDIENMAHGRWYPTVTTLGDGRVMTFSGQKETGGTNATVEIYTMGAGWSPEYPAGWTPPLYPRMHLNRDGRVFYAGPGRGSRFFNPTTKTWTASVATTNHASSRSYGTSVLLPLWPSDGYRSRVMIFGGGAPATATTEIIDLSAATPAWQYGPPMSQPRIQMNATILPNGRVLAMGGSANNEDENTKSLNADLYDPATNTFSSAGMNAYSRLYHSGSLLLPDATVALVGGNPKRGAYQDHIEIYSPAYLFNTDGTPATRPTITGVTPGAFGYGQTFQVQTSAASSIASVVLVRPGAQTHSIDMEQRLVGLNFTAGDGVLNVTAPPHGNIAPPGYYMLFVLDAAGVPSVASFVRIAGSISNQAPTATINSPATDVTVDPGGVVAFSGSGNDPDGTISAYAWTFPGGSPASASVATPGDVVYSTPGTYTASLTVTDNGGLSSPSPATRTITVADFSLSATPTSQTVVPGEGTTYTATVTPLSGFTGTVAFSVTGLPSGATASFSPESVATSGSTTLTIATTPATPAGSHALTIRGTSGPSTSTVDVTLVVNGSNQAPTATITSPATNVTVNPGGSVSFSGSGSDPDGTISAYAWTFPGGSPASASVAAPGNVVYSTPGVRTASLTVTDNGGLSSASPATRTITVADFSLSRTPTSRTVVQGGATTYTATVTPLNGFTGTVAFNVTGLPSGATASFSPESVATSGSTTLTVATTTATPPGTYTLGIRGTSGPRLRTVNVTLIVVDASNQAPTANITSPATNVTVNPGGAVAFSGSGTDPDGTISAYAWTFVGGTPASASVAAPGNVVYSTPGVRTASLSVTDNGGLSSASPATRTITVADFSLSRTPGSRTVVQGGAATYTATVTPLSGFTGTVAFSVTGLPSGATASFSPESVATSGSTTLTVATTTATPPGTYALGIRGTSGPRSRTANVTLIVQ